MRNTARAALLSLCTYLLLGLTACGQVVKEPVVKYVEVQTYRPLPDSLLMIPSILYPENRSTGAVLEAYNFNTPQLEQCIINMEGIVKLQPQK